MKNLFFVSSLVVITIIFTSCHVDPTNQETPALVLEQRTTNWCDGGANNPPAVTIIAVSGTPGNCCVTFRFTSAYVGKTVKLTTTDYNFDTQTGDPGDNNMYFFNSGTGIVQYCFPQQGSHFLIEILDGNGLPFGCNDFENQC